jgi:transposase-like protein
MAPPAAPERDKNHRFPAAIISHGVWLFYGFCLSGHGVEELLFARGVVVTYEAIRKRCRKFGPQYAELHAEIWSDTQGRVMRPCSGLLG